MMGFIQADRRQMKILGYSLDDFVSQDSKCEPFSATACLRVGGGVGEGEHFDY